MLPLLDAVFAQLLLPAPSALQYFLCWGVGFPSKHLVGFIYIAPNLSISPSRRGANSQLSFTPVAFSKP